MAIFDFRLWFLCCWEISGGRITVMMQNMVKIDVHALDLSAHAHSKCWIWPSNFLKCWHQGSWNTSCKKKKKIGAKCLVRSNKKKCHSAANCGSLPAENTPNIMLLFFTATESQGSPTQSVSKVAFTPNFKVNRDLFTIMLLTFSLLASTMVLCICILFDNQMMFK